MFDRKAVFEIPYVEGMDMDEMELDLIDFGLTKIEQDDDTIYAYTGYTDFGAMSAALEEKKIESTKADLQRFPTSPVEFTDEQMVDIEKILDKLDENEDVQAVFTNVE
jgi:transcriptional/translational regulatory protein YebC/TACO1